MGLTKGYANKNSNPLLYGGQPKTETQTYRMDINEYRKLVEKGEGTNEPMTCRKILPGQNVSELSNINIDFESALASRKNAKQTYRKYSNVKRYEDNDWTDGAAAEVENSKLMARPMPPPPSPTVKSLATLPH